MDDTVTVYHGTTSKYLPDILKHGLEPFHAGAGADAWASRRSPSILFTAALEGRPPSVYVTFRQSWAREFAEYATEVNGGERVVILLRIKRSEFKTLFVPDERSETEPSGHITNWRCPKTIPPDAIADWEYV